MISVLKKATVVAFIALNGSGSLLAEKNEAYRLGEKAAVLFVDMLAQLACNKIDQAASAGHRFRCILDEIDDIGKEKANDIYVKDFYTGFSTKFKHKNIRKKAHRPQGKKHEQAAMYAAYDIIVHYLKRLSIKDIMEESSKDIMVESSKFHAEKKNMGTIVHFAVVKAVNEVYGSVPERETRKVMQILKQLPNDFTCLLVYGHINPVKKFANGDGVLHFNERFRNKK